MTLFLHSISFLEVNLNDYLKQATGDIIYLLTAPISTAVPCLKLGNLVHNALLEIAHQLNYTQPMLDTTGTRATEVNVFSLRIGQEAIVSFPRLQGQTLLHQQPGAYGPSLSLNKPTISALNKCSNQLNN